LILPLFRRNSLDISESARRVKWVSLGFPPLSPFCHPAVDLGLLEAFLCCPGSIGLSRRTCRNLAKRRFGKRVNERWCVSRFLLVSRKVSIIAFALSSQRFLAAY